MKRIAELDGLRGLAAIAIVAFHYGEHCWLHHNLLYAGVVSLELFFVLSGYLISTIILEHAGRPGFFRTFYLRRGLRIWPTYYLMIGLYAASWLVLPRSAPAAALPYLLTFTQNVQYYWFARPIPLAYPLTPTWSLAVEEQFYILWPALIGLFGTRRMGRVAVACVAVSVVARYAGFHPWILLARMDGFAIGGLLALALARRLPGGTRSHDLGRTFILLGLASALYLAVGLPIRGIRPFDMTFSTASALDRTVLATFFASVIGLVVCHEGHPRLAPIRARWLVYLGTISYGIYLYHMSAYMAVDVVATKIGLHPAIARGLIAPVLCLAIAAASWRWIERPVLRLKDRFRYAGSPIPAPKRTQPTKPVETADRGRDAVMNAV